MMRLSGTRAYYRPSPPKMPPGLVELMEGLTKEVLKQSPTDVYGFCANHMQQLLEKRDGPSPKKSLSLEEKVARAQEKVRQRAKIRRDEYDKALLQQQQQNSDAAGNDVKQGSTLQVPQLVTAKVPQGVSTDFDKDTVSQNIPNKPIHREDALERSAEMEISHELQSDIGKPITTAIAAESTVEIPMKKDNDLKESQVNGKMIEMENSKSENMVTAESSNESDKTLLNVSLNVNPETENKQTLESVGKIASDVTSDSNTVVDQQTKNSNQKINPVDLKDSAKAENTEGENKDGVNITPKNSALNANAIETTTSRNNDHVNLINSNVSDSYQVETPGKTEDVQVSTDIKQIPKKNEEQIQQSNISDGVQIEENIKTTSVTGVQQCSTTPNSQTISTNDKLNTVPSEDIKLPNTITGKPQESENSNIQRENNPNTVQEVNSDKGNTSIKSDEKVQQLNNTLYAEVSPVKIEEAQHSKNESNKLSNAATGIVQGNCNSDIQRENNPSAVQEVNFDKGNTLIKSDEKVDQTNAASTEVSNIKIEDAQLPKNIESNNLSSTVTGIIQESDNSDTQHGNNPDTTQKDNSDKGNTQIKIDEKAPQLNNKATPEATYLKIEDGQFSNNSESNKSKDVEKFDNIQLNNNAPPEVTYLKIEDGQLSKNSESNKPKDIKKLDNIQLNNNAPPEVTYLTIEDGQLSKNSESNKPKDVEKLDNIEKFIKPAEETKKIVVSEPESGTDLPVTGVDEDIPTMVTENLANKTDKGLKSETLDSKEIRQHDDKENADSGKVFSDHHTHQIAKANSSDSNADFSIPSHSTEDEDISHDDASANMSDKAQNDNHGAGTMDLETAAITIQKVFRNFLFKSRGSTFEDTANDEGNFLDEDDKNKEECEFPIASALNIDRRAHGITRMDTVLQTVNEEKSLSLSTDDSSTLSSAATIIQAHVRGFLVRNKLNSNKTLSTNSLAASNSNEPSITSLEADNDHNKNKTILNIHIVPEGENYFSRDESLITSMDLSLDSSPPSSINLHPLGYDKSERRKQLKREDAIQSISPPSNNSGKLSEDLDSVKELSLNDHDIVGEQLDDHDNNIIKDELAKENRMISPIQNGSLETDVKINENNITNNIDDSETRLKQKRKSLTKMSSDEMDVVTPYMSNEDSASSILIHSGEFHDAVLPTRVSRSDTSVVSGE